MEVSFHSTGVLFTSLISVMYDLDQTTKSYCWDALSFAVMNGYTAAVKVCLDQDINPNLAPLPNGMTVLMIAAYEGRLEIMTTLIPVMDDIETTSIGEIT